MSGLIERLRRYRSIMRGGHPFICDEAADTIEALVDALRGLIELQPPVYKQDASSEREAWRKAEAALSCIDTLPATQGQGVAADAAGLSPSVEPLRVSPPDGASIPNAEAWFCERGNFWGTANQLCLCAKCGKSEAKPHNEPRHYAGIFTPHLHMICDECFASLPGDDVPNPSDTGAIHE